MRERDYQAMIHLGIVVDVAMARDGHLIQYHRAPAPTSRRDCVCMAHLRNCRARAPQREAWHTLKRNSVAAIHGAAGRPIVSFLLRHGCVSVKNSNLTAINLAAHYLVLIYEVSNLHTQPRQPGGSIRCISEEFWFYSIQEPSTTQKPHQGCGRALWRHY